MTTEREVGLAPDINIVMTQHENFLVEINGDVYEMNRQADRPNGLCMYQGNRETNSELDRQMRLNRRYDGDLSLGMVRKIAQIHASAERERVEDDEF